MKNLIFVTITGLSLAIYSGCSSDEASNGEPTTAGGAAGSNASGGTATAGSGGAYDSGAGGTDGGASGGEAGSANGCPVCAELDEAACKAAEESEGVCRPVYGHPFANPEVSEYAGCGNDCTQPGSVSSETCAMPAGEADRCFQLQSGFAPEGWTILSEVELCSEDLGCE